MLTNVIVVKKEQVQPVNADVAALIATGRGLVADDARQFDQELAGAWDAVLKAARSELPEALWPYLRVTLNGDAVETLPEELEEALYLMVPGVAPVKISMRHGRQGRWAMTSLFVVPGIVLGPGGLPEWTFTAQTPPRSSGCMLMLAPVGAEDVVKALGHAAATQEEMEAIRQVARRHVTCEEAELEKQIGRLADLNARFVVLEAASRGGLELLVEAALAAGWYVHGPMTVIASEDGARYIQAVNGVVRVNFRTTGD